jgi:hypothetical protein
MARDFGGLFPIEDMSDDELRDLIVQHFNEYDHIDAGWIDVDVQDGFVTLSGRVGTDGEVQVAEKVLAEVIGIKDYSNELMVDETHRGQLPEGADVASTVEQEMGADLGGGILEQSDTADHLMEHLENEAYGTHDMQAAIRDGTAYSPPDRPIPDGYDSREEH